MTKVFDKKRAQNSPENGVLRAPVKKKVMPVVVRAPSRAAIAFLEGFFKPSPQ
jgi:hypothetical protein